ncbi:MAG: class I SAM-dependent methyltransferase [Anaerolineae bacterium]|nr:class I SAM-dependent methyltransferase [Anaerolineae bacterium]
MFRLLVLAIPILLAFLFWLFIFGEGTYLGSTVVTFLYDRAASAYDRVKRLDSLSDRWHVALPLERALSKVAHPLILDVATGTGRLPLDIASGAGFAGHIIGLDLSTNMLREAQEKTRALSDAISLIRANALALPVADATCDAVTCLEGLELFPRPEEALQEMARVLRSGGVLLVSNRVDREAILLPGRAYRRDQIEGVLEGLSFSSVKVKRWQRHYDLVWAKLSGGPGE